MLRTYRWPSWTRGVKTEAGTGWRCTGVTQDVHMYFLSDVHTWKRVHTRAAVIQKVHMYFLSDVHMGAGGYTHTYGRHSGSTYVLFN